VGMLKQIKTKVLVLVMVMMTFTVPYVHAANFYWHGDPNYPRVRSHMYRGMYVDLSSAWVVDKTFQDTSKKYIIKYNILSINEEEDTVIAPHTQTTLIVKSTESSYTRYFRINENGDLDELDPETAMTKAYEMACRDAAIEAENYLRLNGELD